MAESEVASFIKQICRRMKSFPVSCSVCSVILLSRHLSFLLSESQEIHISSAFLEYHPPSERCAFAAVGAEAATRWGW